MRWPGLLEAYKKFLPVNNEKAVTYHIRGVVKG